MNTVRIHSDYLQVHQLCVLKYIMARLLQSIVIFILKPSVNEAKLLQFGHEQKAEGRDKQQNSSIGPVKEKAEEEERN